MTERLLGRGKDSGRADDNPETIKKRLETYENETLPVVKDFESKGNCVRIDATKGKEEVYEEIKEKLREANVEPPPKSPIIFVLGGPGSGKGTYSLFESVNVQSLSKDMGLSTYRRETC